MLVATRKTSWARVFNFTTFFDMKFSVTCVRDDYFSRQPKILLDQQLAHIQDLCAELWRQRY